MDKRGDLKRKRASAAASSGAGEKPDKLRENSSSKKKRAAHSVAAAALPKEEEEVEEEMEMEKTKTAKHAQKQAPLPGSWAPSAAGGFKLVPLRIKQQQQQQGEEAQQGDHPWRYLYIRQHRAGSQASGGGPEAWDSDDHHHHVGQEEAATTLFVTNVGDDSDTSAVEEHLLRLFGRCAPVESVTIKSLRRVSSQTAGEGQRHPHQPRPAHQSGRGPWLEVTQSDEAEARPLVFAHVAFSSPDGLRSALRFDWRSAAAEDSTTDQSQAPDGRGGGGGVQKWLKEYDDARPDPQRVLAEVDAFMADFDRRQRMAEREEEAALGKPDADGFVTVRRKGRKKVADGGVPIASTKATPALAAKAQRQESDKVLLDFYRFQRRENRRKQLADLRLRFEEDKKKIAKLRTQRKFKPF